MSLSLVDTIVIAIVVPVVVVVVVIALTTYLLYRRRVQVCVVNASRRGPCSSGNADRLPRRSSKSITIIACTNTTVSLGNRRLVGDSTPSCRWLQLRPLQTSPSRSRNTVQWCSTNARNIVNRWRRNHRHLAAAM
jgi:hypothetical protein